MAGLERLSACVDVLVAKGLRNLNEAAGLAEYITGRGDAGEYGPAVQRALLARRVIVEAGIPLPAPQNLTILRNISEQEKAQAQASGQWTINRMVARAGVHRTTVVRWLQALGGPVLERYAAALDAGELAIFTFTGEEAREILRQGGADWVMDQEAGGAPEDEEGNPEDTRNDTCDHPAEH